MWLLEVLMGMVARAYSEDDTTAGVVLAKLDNGRYYASIARYTDPSTKVVVCHAYADSASAAIQILATGWCSSTGQQVPVQPSPPRTVLPMRARSNTTPEPRPSDKMDKPEEFKKDRIELLELE